jgi:hypothetical protein
LAVVSGLLVLALLPQSASAATPRLRDAGEGSVVELRGRVVCSSADAAAEPCDASCRFALETPRCNVVACAPGPCPCCRRTMALRETPLP